MNVNLLITPMRTSYAIVWYAKVMTFVYLAKWGSNWQLRDARSRIVIDDDSEGYLVWDCAQQPFPFAYKRACYNPMKRVNQMKLRNKSFHVDHSLSLERVDDANKCRNVTPCTP